MSIEMVSVLRGLYTLYRLDLDNTDIKIYEPILSATDYETKLLGFEDVALIITPEILNTLKSIHIDLETALANLTPEPTNMSDTDSDRGGSGPYKIKTQL